MSLAVGDLAPDFALHATDGRVVRLSEFRGDRAVVVFFYPKDDTLGCTVEACAFRDQHASLEGAGATVIGISSDSVESHDRFARRHQLPMTLLSDEDGRVRSLYGVKATLGLLPGRATFVIDRHGFVRHVFVSQLQFARHAEEAAQVVRRLQSSDAGGST